MTTETTNYKLGQVGFGTIGEIYSGHLIKANGQLILYDIDRERLEQLAPEQTELADSPRQVAEASEIIILALPSPEAVKSVVFWRRRHPQGRATRFLDPRYQHD